MLKKLCLLILFFSISACAFSLDETFESYNGGTVTYKDMASKKKAVLFLWTSRCPYCMNELKKMNQAPELTSYAKFYFVNLAERRQDVDRVARQLGLKKHILENIIIDKDVALANKFSIVGVPTFLFMREGNIIGREYYFDINLLKEIFGHD